MDTRATAGEGVIPMFPDPDITTSAAAAYNASPLLYLCVRDLLKHFWYGPCGKW